MTRLTELAAPTAAPASEARAYRRVGSRLLLVDAAGRHAWTTPAAAKHGLSWTQPAAAQGLENWPGPALHVVELSRGTAVAECETVRRAIDFAFCAPTKPLAFELCGAAADAAWPAARFAVQYAERRAEWGKRPVAVTLRAAAPLPAERVDWLRRRKAAVRLELEVAGKPSVCPKADRLRVRITARGRRRDASSWVKAWTASGAKGVSLEPALGLSERAFLSFYVAALEALLRLNGPREEFAAALLSGRRWALPGLDVVSELFYAFDGAVYTSETAGHDVRARAVLMLGVLGTLRYQELAGQELVRACLAAALPQAQPMCLHCVYGTRCAVAPSVSLAQQGSLYGRAATSERCRLNMAVLDLLYETLRRGGKAAKTLSRWAKQA